MIRHYLLPVKWTTPHWKKMIVRRYKAMTDIKSLTLFQSNRVRKKVRTESMETSEPSMNYSPTLKVI